MEDHHINIIEYKIFRMNKNVFKYSKMKQETFKLIYKDCNSYSVLKD